MGSLGRADWLSLGIVAAATAVGLVVVPDLPPEMAIHFAASGEPDDYVPRSVAVISVPLVALATIALLRGAARLDPPNDSRSMDIVVVGTTALLAGVHLFVLGWNLGYRIPVVVVIVGAVLWGVVIVGYVVVRETE